MTKRCGYPDEDCVFIDRYHSDTIHAQDERIAALEAAVRAAWTATQSVEMGYEDIALAVETALSPVLDWSGHEDHLSPDRSLRRRGIL